MSTVISFILLGLGTGAVYALLGQGIVLIYRASGILNFAHGAMAMGGAFLFYQLNDVDKWSVAPAVIVTVLAMSAVGACVYQLLMRPLRFRSGVVRLIATLAVLLIIQSIATIKYGATTYFPLTFLPNGLVRITSSITVPADQLWLAGIAVGLTLALYLVSHRTKFGLATLAVSENERSSAAVGWSPHLLGTVNWALGAGLAAIAGILIAPLTSLSAVSLTFVVVPAMAAALVGGFSSFPLTLAGAMLIGIGQSEITNYINAQNAADALPLVVIVIVLIFRGQSLPIRSHLLDRLPQLGASGFRPRGAVVITASAVILALVLPVTWVTALSVSAAAVVILLSIVVITGYAGQLSLAQYGFAGLGALCAAKLVADQGWPFELALLAGVAAAVVTGVVFGLPALRARGTNLAIVTLAGGFALSQVVFGNDSISDAFNGINVGQQHFLGISIDTVTHPGNYAIFAIVCALVATFIVCNLRVSRTGRQLIAVRTNERAAASLGVDVLKAKLYAFAVSAGLAGLGGIIVTFLGPVIYITGYDSTASVNAVLLAVVGGVGYPSGALYGSTLASGGLPGGVIADHVGNGLAWLALVSAVVVVLVILRNPDGVAYGNSIMIRRLMSTVARGRRASAEPADMTALGVKPRAGFAGPTVRARHELLEVRDATVRFGGVVAVDHVSLSVRAGEVVGLIGPNGAGKTTMIDVITGFVRGSGEILLDGERIDGWSPAARARGGVTRSFQSLELFDDITVLDNLRAASDPKDSRTYLTDLVHPRHEALSPAAATVVAGFELEADLMRRPDELSYGRRRLVAVARAAATSPGFLLLDEPVAGMGEAESAEVGRLIRQLARDLEIGIVLIEHDVSLVMSTCDRIVVLDFGKAIAGGTPAEVRNDPAVIAAYLGVDAEQVDELATQDA